MPADSRLEGLRLAAKYDDKPPSRAWNPLANPGQGTDVWVVSIDKTLFRVQKSGRQSVSSRQHSMGAERHVRQVSCCQIMAPCPGASCNAIASRSPSNRVISIRRMPPPVLPTLICQWHRAPAYVRRSRTHGRSRPCLHGSSP
jgi:hypothetical protein